MEPLDKLSMQLDEYLSAKEDKLRADGGLNTNQIGLVFLRKQAIDNFKLLVNKVEWKGASRETIIRNFADGAALIKADIDAI